MWLMQCAKNYILSLHSYYISRRAAPQKIIALHIGLFLTYLEVFLAQSLKLLTIWKFSRPFFFMLQGVRKKRQCKRLLQFSNFFLKNLFFFAYERSPLCHISPIENAKNFQSKETFRFSNIVKLEPISIMQKDNPFVGMNA